MSRLGGNAPGPMPQDGRAYVVVDGKWVEVAHDGADGVPARLRLPDDSERSEDNGTAKVV